MKKYINMVVGLLLLLIFLQPLFQLFHIDSEDILSRALPALDTTAEDENMKNSIEMKKTEIQASQDAYVLEEMAVQMKDQAKEELNNTYGVAITDILYGFEKEDELDIDKLNQVTVSIVEEEHVTTSDGEVDDVVIDLNKNEEKTTDDSSKTDQVRTYLAELWQLEENIIQVQWEGGV